MSLPQRRVHMFWARARVLHLRRDIPRLTGAQTIYTSIRGAAALQRVPLRSPNPMAFATQSSLSATQTPWTKTTYPASRRSDHVDVYKSEKHGEVRVPDPYNWLEQNSEETEAWTTAQADFTRNFLDQYPHRDDIERQLRENFNYEKVCPKTPASIKTRHTKRKTFTH